MCEIKQKKQYFMRARPCFALRWASFMWTSRIDTLSAAPTLRDLGGWEKKALAFIE